MPNLGPFRACVGVDLQLFARLALPATLGVRSSILDPGWPKCGEPRCLVRQLMLLRLRSSDDNNIPYFWRVPQLGGGLLGSSHSTALPKIPKILLVLLVAVVPSGV